MELSTNAPTMEFEVQHGKQLYVGTFPLSHTIEEVKEWLHETAKVPTSKQLLLLNAPVTKEFRKIVSSSKNKLPHPQGGENDSKSVHSSTSIEIDSTPLSSIISSSLLQKVQELGSTSTPQRIKVRGILIGSAEPDSDVQVQQLTTEATSVLSRIVSSTLEQNGSWYRCSYSQGYVRQMAYVCRTCVKEGRASPDHAICFACTEVCHFDHDVEEWGARYHMRCDCCTSKCWKSSSISSLHCSHPENELHSVKPSIVGARKGEKGSLQPSFSCTLGGSTSSSQGVSAGSSTERATQASMKDVTMEKAEKNERRRNSSGSSGSSVISVVTSGQVEARTSRKRSRSPLMKPHAGHGVPSLSGVRAPAVANPLSPPSSTFVSEDEKNTKISSPSDSLSKNESNMTSSMTPLPDSTSASQKEVEPTHSQSNGTRSAPVSMSVGNGVEKAAASSLSSQKTLALRSIGTSASASPSSSTASRDHLSQKRESTPASSRNSIVLPSFEGCRFILDSETNRPPAIVIPTNVRNRYPRRLETWCYCEEDELVARKDEDGAENSEDGSDDDRTSKDSVGLVCMLCTSCFWSSHIVSLHSDQMRRVPCYGDVLQGEVVVFYCITCETFVCPPCRYRCHKDHEVEEERILSSDLPKKIPEKKKQQLERVADLERMGMKQQGGEESGSRLRKYTSPISEHPAAAVGAHMLAERITGVNSLKEGEELETTVGNSFGSVVFTCGCRGLCSIAESVPPEEENDSNAFLPVPSDVAADLVNNDVFNGFICAECMEEYPWLLTTDLQKCMNGELPPKVTDSSAFLPILPCKKLPSDVPDKKKYYPYHGMVMPITAFSNRCICSCDKCQAAFNEFAPWGTKDAEFLMMNLYDHCSVCQLSIGNKTAFLCKTCEMTSEEAFMLCTECNAHRLAMVEDSRRTVPPLRVASESENETSEKSRAENAEGKATQCSNSSSTSIPQAQRSTYVNSQGVEVTYEHPLSHQFLEDTDENLFALCGMQIAVSLDQESQVYLSENIGELKNFAPEIGLQENFEPQPITFTQEELKAFAVVNAPRSHSVKKKK